MQVPDYSTFTYWIFGTFSALALFASVLAHELSHSLVARRLGIGVRQITLFIFGGVSEMEQTHSSSPKSEFRITIAGPLASFGMGALFFVLAAVASQLAAERIVIATLHYLYYVNFLLGAFNLIPGFPLDGGRVLRSYLWHRTGNLRQATRSASRVGGAFALGFMLIGLFSVLTMHIIPGIWLILIGMFLKKSAEAEYQSFEVRVGLQDMKLRDIMLPPLALTTSTTVADFVSNYVFRHHLRAFPVTELNRFIGMIDVRNIRKLPPNEWATAKIGAYLSDTSTYCTFDPDMEAGDALQSLLTRNCTQAPVVRNESLLGLITREELLKVISLKRDLAA